jgi:hypothetical protein
MSAWPAVAMALLLPTLFGAACWALLAGWPRSRAGWLLAAGEGYLLGALLLGNALWLAGPVATDGLLWRWGAVLLVLAAALGGLAWRGRAAASAAVTAPPPLARSERWLIAAAVAVLVLVGVMIAWQAVLLPTLTWDAWNAWLAKAKAWHHAGALLPVVDLTAWLQRAPAPVLSTVAAAYPEALPRFVAWVAAAGGSWRDGHAHLAWPVLWFALGAIVAGALRSRGLRWGVAVAAAGLLLTLPLVTAHAALAGYADLWLAAGLLAAGHHAARHAATGARRELVLALLFAALLPTIKLEGAVWMLLLVAAIALWTLPPRRRWALAGGGALLAVLALLLLPRVVLPVPGLGLVVVQGASITVPVVGTLELFWRDVGATVAQSLFLLPNWSLLWYALPVVVAVRWRRLGDPGQGPVGAALAVGFGFLFVLFFFTDASRWAENLTSLNRLLLHAVPLLLVWATLLLDPARDRAAVRGRWS